MLRGRKDATAGLKGVSKKGEVMSELSEVVGLVGERESGGFISCSITAPAWRGALSNCALAANSPTNLSRVLLVSDDVLITPAVH